jgi:chromosome segregation ATPase
MSELQRNYDSQNNIPGQPFGSKVIVASKHASIEPPQSAKHTWSRELVEVRNSTASESSTTRSPHMLKDELSSLTDELSSLTDELSFLTGELSSLTGKLSALTGKPHARTDELHAHTANLSSRIDELKEKNLAFQKQVTTTKQLNSASISTIIDPLEAMERDTIHSDDFKINVRLVKFFAEEAGQELHNLKGDDFEDIDFFDDANWPLE